MMERSAKHHNNSGKQQQQQQAAPTSACLRVENSGHVVAGRHALRGTRHRRVVACNAQLDEVMTQRSSNIPATSTQRASPTTLYSRQQHPCRINTAGITYNSLQQQQHPCHIATLEPGGAVDQDVHCGDDAPSRLLTAGPPEAGGSLRLAPRSERGAL
ncbi:unnamed protein product [Lampetra fluviatilis]